MKWPVQTALFHPRTSHDVFFGRCSYWEMQGTIWDVFVRIIDAQCRWLNKKKIGFFWNNQKIPFSSQCSSRGRAVASHSLPPSRVLARLCSVENLRSCWRARYCIMVVLFENLVGCSSILRRRMRPRRPQPLAEITVDPCESWSLLGVLVIIMSTK